MPRKKREIPPLATIWRVPDAVWHRLNGILNERYPKQDFGRPRADLRQVLDGIVYRLRSGVQWNHLPPEFGDDSTVHRWFQRWAADGVFEELWAALLLECDDLGGVEWKWQAVDGCMGKARFGGAKPVRTRRIEARVARRKVSSARGMATLSAS